MTLHCKSQRGSPYILYEFYHENVSLGNSSTLSGEGGGASFNFSMSTERSGNYHCTADNGLGAQNSEAIWISVAGKSWAPADTHCYTDFPLNKPFWKFAPTALFPTIITPALF